MYSFYGGQCCLCAESLYIVLRLGKSSEFGVILSVGCLLACCLLKWLEFLELNKTPLIPMN